MRRAGHERIKQMDLLCKRLDNIPEITFFYKGYKAILFYAQFIFHMIFTPLFSISLMTESSSFSYSV